MRCMLISFSVLLMLFSQDLFASAKTDSMVAFLGGVDARFVWKRWAWCNDDYSPKAESKAKNDGYSFNASPKTPVVCLWRFGRGNSALWAESITSRCGTVAPLFSPTALTCS